MADGGQWAERSEQHEAAAHQKRNWVRLTFECNDRCIFCLDSDTHDGRMRDPQEVKAQILDGRRKGAERLILSGGEPTIHPRYVDFIRLGRLAGYERVQTVTNGRMFSYQPFLQRCLDEGLQEITFSIHGPNAKVHDALVGVKGAYEEEIQGLRYALADGRPIVNVDICVNRGNVKHLPAMLEGLYAMGVREFDLLHVIPFGNAWRDGKDVLFYDLDKARDALVESFSWAHRDDVHVWLNRFPVEHLEGFHALIQDPYKLTDEIRGRKEEYARWIDGGEPLDCREPRRCGYCYLKRVCDDFEGTLTQLVTPRFDRLRVDAHAAQSVKPVYGGDPASARKLRLPLVSRQFLSWEALAEKGEARVLRVVAQDAESASDAAARFMLPELELVLAKVTDAQQLAPYASRLTRVDVQTVAEAMLLLASEGTYAVGLALMKENADWLLDLQGDEPWIDRLRLYQPTWERVTEARTHDLNLQDFFRSFALPIPVRGLPECVVGDRREASLVEMDTAMLDEGGRLAPFQFIGRYIEDRYHTKSLRCRTCRAHDDCQGVHVNHVRAQGFGMMQPLSEPTD